MISVGDCVCTPQGTGFVEKFTPITDECDPPCDTTLYIVKLDGHGELGFWLNEITVINGIGVNK